MFLELTYKADGKRVLVNMALVRLVYPMADGSDLIFDPNHTATVVEGHAEISQRLAARKRARKARTAGADASK